MLPMQGLLPYASLLSLHPCPSLVLCKATQSRPWRIWLKEAWMPRVPGLQDDGPAWHGLCSSRSVTRSQRFRTHAVSPGAPRREVAMTSIEEVRMATSTLNGQESTVSTVSLEMTAELLNGSGTAARRSSETLQTHTRTPLENDPWIYRIVVVVLGLVMLT